MNPFLFQTPKSFITIMKKISILFSLLSFLNFCSAQNTPELFKNILIANQPVNAELVIIVPPSEIQQYIKKVEANAIKNQAWFEEYSKSSPPGVPLPFHENLGLSHEEYDQYIAAWGKREFKVIEKIKLMLRKNSQDRWSILASGEGESISSLHYSEKDDNWKSTNGEMTRIKDIVADKMSILGAWNGKEWKYSEETNISKLKENFALGKTVDGKYNLLIYRAQEMTEAGTPLLDKSIVIRIPQNITEKPKVKAEKK
jgi:hypothetical protein